MMLITNNQLDAKQLRDLNELCQSCKKVDGSLIATYNHLLAKERPVSKNLLYYDGDRLIGFLSLFFFYDDACEVALMVDPNHRAQGIAKDLLREVLPMLRSQRILTLVFSAPGNLHRSIFIEHGFSYRNSEYQMRLKSPAPLPITRRDLQVRLATMADLVSLAAIDSACFHTDPVEVKVRFFNLLNDPDYRIFVALTNGLVIGKTHILFQANHARFCDIGILPEFQSQGFAKGMLAHCINYCLSANQTNITLDVETKNEHASNLYSHTGFVVSNVYDFWTIPIGNFEGRDY